jgi:2-polyprenyl-3-methyl-5-hydroxy-6-metoxy-1,4-benzoquinol methylase
MIWYKDWFNADEYLRVYKHRDDAEAKLLIDLILSRIDNRKVKSVLDMACGTGRHSITLAKKGFEVTAVDLSNNLLNEAIKISKTAGVEIDFILSDIREFEPLKKYQLAVNLFTSFGYFKEDEENFKVIDKANQCLSDNGYFVIDYFNKNFLESNIIPSTVDKNNGSTITQKRSLIGNRVVKEILIEKQGSTKSYHESVRLFSFEEISNILKRSEFKILDVFGDYTGSKFVVESSPRVIIIAQK